MYINNNKIKKDKKSFINKKNNNFEKEKISLISN